ncbi:MAG: transposase [Betaproteobacteria bacterium]|jgi:REP element-mobilizing transposase RayT|nr:transposase [Betaproteobacteria bacterium]MBK7459798.1 transposase [Betaproteobacteria bacterium]MBK7517647.1 transposase [Betaproteobacteria bacterium]MBK9684707.1 transposase [Betaproteobacteria bacterium]MBL0297907.1 transposase [Betaproteobacteria bacterium]
MSRPLRIEFPGATYHVTARGDRREAIFVDDTDRAGLLDVLAQGLQRFDAVALAYCLMGNHYHFVLQTRQANLSRLMRHVNGVHTQRFNRRHGQVGHLFQGRFKAILVDTDAYLLTLCRYVELNPVRAGWAADPLAWAWSSCRAHVGAAPAPVWLDTQGLHAQLMGRECRTAAEAAQAARRYAALLESDPALQIWPGALQRQIYLGDDAFVGRMQALGGSTVAAVAAAEVPRIQRRPPHRPSQAADGGSQMPADSWSTPSAARSAALWRAYREEGVTMTALAARCGISVSRVSRLIAAVEGAKGKT